ncbi:hypothetical protein V6N13_018626 [Hibiscus sabdariffa]
MLDAAECTKSGEFVTSYHRNCFKCSHGGCTISPSNYIAHAGKLFKDKGNYSQLECNRQEDLTTEKFTNMEIAVES